MPLVLVCVEVSVVCMLSECWLLMRVKCKLGRVEWSERTVWAIERQEAKASGQKVGAMWVASLPHYAR